MLNSTRSISHETVARLAYKIWEEMGRQDGNDAAHWLQAERELRVLAEIPKEADRARGTSVEPPVSGKHFPERAPHSANYVHPGITTDSLHHLRHQSGHAG